MSTLRFWRRRAKAGVGPSAGSTTSRRVCRRVRGYCALICWSGVSMSVPRLPRAVEQLAKILRSARKFKGSTDAHYVPVEENNDVMR